MKLLVLGHTTELRAELKLDFIDFLLPHFGMFCSMWVASGHRDCVNPHFKVAGRMLYWPETPWKSALWFPTSLTGVSPSTCVCNAQPNIIFHATRTAQKITEIAAHMSKGADQWIVVLLGIYVFTPKKRNLSVTATALYKTKCQALFTLCLEEESCMKAGYWLAFSFTVMWIYSGLINFFLLFFPITFLYKKKIRSKQSYFP